MSKIKTMNLETELTHSRNLLSVATDQIERILDTGDTSKLSNILSVIIKATDNIDDQLDIIIEHNVRTA